MVHLDSIVPQTVSIRGTLSRSPLPRPDAPVSAVRLKQTGGVWTRPPLLIWAGTGVFQVSGGSGAGGDTACWPGCHIAILPACQGESDGTMRCARSRPRGTMEVGQRVRDLEP